MPAVDTMESTTSAAPLIPPVYDVAFTALWLLILAVTVVAIVVVAFSRQTATPAGRTGVTDHRRARPEEALPEDSGRLTRTASHTRGRGRRH
jgi:membrane protein implicated in regulation of membrane protease activity